MQTSLTVEAKVAQPASWATFDRGGELVTADAGHVVRWQGKTPGTAIDTSAWGGARGLAVADDGTVLAGAARVAADGTIAGDPEAFRAGYGVTGPKLRGALELTAAAWRLDGSAVWMSVRRHAPASGGPRFLVLDPGAAVARELTPGGTWWTSIVVGDRWVATVGDRTTLWPDGADPIELRPAPAVAIGGGGAVVVVAELGQVRAFSARDGKELARWDVAGLSIGAVAVSPDGARVATVDDQGALRLWALAGGAATELASVTVEPMTSGVAFSPDGRRLAAVAATGTVFVTVA